MQASKVNAKVLELELSRYCYSHGLDVAAAVRADIRHHVYRVVAERLIYTTDGPPVAVYYPASAWDHIKQSVLAWFKPHMTWKNFRWLQSCLPVRQDVQRFAPRAMFPDIAPLGERHNIVYCINPLPAEFPR